MLIILYFRGSVDLEDYALRSCLDMGFPGVQEASPKVSSYISEDAPSDVPFAAQTPRCTDSPSSVDDCQDDVSWNKASHYQAVYLVCDEPQPGGGAGNYGKYDI